MAGGSAPTGGGRGQQPFTGGGAGGNPFGGLGKVGLRPMTTPTMPAQQNFQQNQATMQPAGPMAGGGINQPLANPTQGPANPLSAPREGLAAPVGMQGQDVRQQAGSPNRFDTSQAYGTHWQGNPNLFVGGRNNYITPPRGWRGSDPGDVSQATLDQLQGNVKGLQGNMRDVRQDIRQGDRNPQAMGLLRTRMNNLRAFQNFMQAHAGAPGAAPGTDPAIDPNAAPGIASDAWGHTTNSAQLLAMLAAQQGM